MTKLLPLLAAALIGTAAPLLASTATDIPGDRFSLQHDRNGSSVIRFGNINADPGSIIEVYDYRLGQQGPLLATEALRPGRNVNVRISVGEGRQVDVLAILKVNGVVVGQQVMDADGE